MWEMRDVGEYEGGDVGAWRGKRRGVEEEMGELEDLRRWRG